MHLMRIQFTPRRWREECYAIPANHKSLSSQQISLDTGVELYVVIKIVSASEQVNETLNERAARVDNHSCIL